MRSLKTNRLTLDDLILLLLFKLILVVPNTLSIVKLLPFVLPELVIEDSLGIVSIQISHVIRLYRFRLLHENTLNLTA